jgi:hypothetical protein
VHIEGGIERVNVAHNLVAAKLGGRVGVDGEQSKGLFVARDLLPRLGPRQKEPLRPREAINDRGLATVEGNLVGLPRYGQAAQVADVLANRQLTVDSVPGRGRRF